MRGVRVSSGKPQIQSAPAAQVLDFRGAESTQRRLVAPGRGENHVEHFLKNLSEREGIAAPIERRRIGLQRGASVGDSPNRLDWQALRRDGQRGPEVAHPGLAPRETERVAAWRIYDEQRGSEAIRKETACFLDATVTALRGRVFPPTEARPRKAVTVAPKTNTPSMLQQIDFQDSRSVFPIDRCGGTVAELKGVRTLAVVQVFGHLGAMLMQLLECRFDGLAGAG